MRTPIRTPILLTALTAAATAPTLGQEIIFETADPFGSPFGFVGFDVFEDQSVGVRFTPDRDYRLTRVSAWFMSNDFSAPQPDPVRLSIRTDDTSIDSRPSSTVLESMDLTITAIGWDPMLDSTDASGGLVLEAGTRYWLVAESDRPILVDPVWNFATGVTGFTATTLPDGTWQAGGSGATVGVVIEGAPIPTICPADLDGDGELTIFDFLQFQNLFDAGDLTADFDGDGELTIFDFLAFQNEFDAGCE